MCHGNSISIENLLFCELVQVKPRKRLANAVGINEKINERMNEKDENLNNKWKIEMVLMNAALDADAGPFLIGL